MRLLALLVSLLAFNLADPVQAQEHDNDDIVVTAPAIEEVARAFAREVSVPPSRENQLARFESRTCPGVIGLGARQGHFLVDRIAQRARQLELDIGQPGCRANILVLVSTDASGVAQAIVEEQRYLMANYGLQENLSTRGSEALADFVERPRPVRWWHVAQTQTVDGDVLGHTNPYGRMQSPSSQEFRGAEVTRMTMSDFGRMSRATLQSIRNVVVIVDAQRVGPVRLDALADYIAMVALAQIEPTADTSGYDTVLNLFSDVPTGQSGMTDWDVAYLRGLYAGPGNQPNTEWQARGIARRMRDDLTRPQ